MLTRDLYFDREIQIIFLIIQFLLLALLLYIIYLFLNTEKQYTERSFLAEQDVFLLEHDI